MGKALATASVKNRVHVHMKLDKEAHVCNPALPPVARWEVETEFPEAHLPVCLVCTPTKNEKPCLKHSRR